MDNQIFISGRIEGPKSHDFDFNKIKPVENKPEFNLKPNGGLWTSSENEEISDWVRWCKGNMPDWIKKAKVFRLKPKPDARIFTIDCWADAKRLQETYPVKSLMSRMTLHFLNVDWIKISNDYDGVRLTDKGQWETRMCMECSLYGWDCESTLWFRNVFDSVELLGTLEVKEGEEEFGYPTITLKEPDQKGGSDLNG
jgi:hypothetical protein